MKSNKNLKERAEVRSYWDNQAREKGNDPLATTNDRILRDLEIEATLKYIPHKKVKILDVGCGNGFNIFAFAKERSATFVGVDFSEEMVRAAKSAMMKEKNLKGSISFQTGDVLNLPFADKAFDIVVTGRCLVNMVSLNDQKKALVEIARVLKKGGKAILCEGSKQGMAQMNMLRKAAGLPEVLSHWHNIYLDEDKIVPFAKKNFYVRAIDCFSSTYFIASRIFNAVAAKDPSKPDYLSIINRTAAKLPAIGEHGSLKIYYLEKK